MAGFRSYRLRIYTHVMDAQKKQNSKYQLIHAVVVVVVLFLRQSLRFCFTILEISSYVWIHEETDEDQGELLR